MVKLAVASGGNDARAQFLAQAPVRPRRHRGQLAEQHVDCVENASPVKAGVQVLLRGARLHLQPYESP
jgi:hypothetical protein